MVSRYTRFRVLLPDNTPPPHCDNPCDFNGLASMLPKVRVSYGFRITRIAFFLTGCPRGFSRPCRLGSGHACRSWWFARRCGRAVPAPFEARFQCLSYNRGMTVLLGSPSLTVFPYGYSMFLPPAIVKQKTFVPPEPPISPQVRGNQQMTNCDSGDTILDCAFRVASVPVSGA